MESQQSKGDKPFKSVYVRATESVLAELEKGTAPWRKPWRAEAGLPRNLVSRKAYRGVNVLTLMGGALAAGYPSNWWLTFLQAQELGGFVRRGEHGFPVIFYSRIPEGQTAYGTDDEDEAPDVRWRSVLKTFTVFNVSQCADIPVPQPPRMTWQPLDAAEKIVEAASVPVFFAGTEAYYEPKRDLITVPPRPYFDSVTGFYETLLHELVHATGHESRLDRPGGPHGSDGYCWEELIAEMGSAMLSVVVGIPAPDFPNIASYIHSWRKRMQRDAQAVCEAAAAAQKAVEWLLAKAGLPLPE
jgi:antirestriction protein ArdC